MNVTNDEVHWLEDFNKKDDEILYSESDQLINDALSFYDKEIGLI